jgi:hypothetical protein
VDVDFAGAQLDFFVLQTGYLTKRIHKAGGR